MSSTNTPFFKAESLKIQRGEGTHAKIILDGSPECTFVLESGYFYHLAGSSGVGKSTLLWTLARLHPLIAGSLWFYDKLHTHITLARWRAEIALLPQKPVIMPGTVADNLLYPLHTFHIQKERLNERHELLPNNQDLRRELDWVGLHDIPLERGAAALSGGQQARLTLIRLLLTKPKLILADEPTAGVDDIAADLVLNRLQQFCETGGVVMMTSHVHGERMNGTQIMLNNNAKFQFKVT